MARPYRFATDWAIRTCNIMFCWLWSHAQNMKCGFHLLMLLGLPYTHTHPFNGPFSGTTQVSRYQKGKANLDFTGARDSEWQWHQLGCMQVCTSLQTDNHASTPPLSLACHVNLKLIWLWFLEDGSLCDVADVWPSWPSVIVPYHCLFVTFCLQHACHLIAGIPCQQFSDDAGHTFFMPFSPGLPRWASTRKV